MTISEDRLQVLQLCFFFMKNHGYQFVKSPNDSSDLWLANNDNSQFPLIRISNRTTFISEEEYKELHTFHSYVSTLFNRTHELLDIHIIREEVKSNYSDITVVAIKDNYYDGKDISFAFPTIKNQLTHSENVEKDFSILSQDMRLYEMNKNAKKTSQSRTKQYPIATYVIGIICCVVFLLIQIFSSSFSNSTTAAIFFGAYYKAFVMAGEWWRLLTVGFVHQNPVHLCTNMLSLYWLGKTLEPTFGRKQYVAILLLSVIAGSVFVFAAEGNIVCVGLSGGLYGLMGALLVYTIHTGLIRNPMVIKNLAVIFVLNIAVNFLPGIGVWAHLGGFVAGALLAVIFTKDAAWKELRKHTCIALACTLLVLGFACFKNYTVGDTIYLGTDLEILEVENKMGLSSYSSHILKQLGKVYNIDLGGYFYDK